MGTKKCRFIVKIDSAVIKSEEVIDKKFKELKEAKSWASTNLAIIGMQLMGEVDII